MPHHNGSTSRFLSEDLFVRRRLLWPPPDIDGTTLVLLIAPPGFGKTTLLMQHYLRTAAGGRQCLWVDAGSVIARRQSLARYIWDSLGPESTGMEDAPPGSAQHKLFDIMADRDTGLHVYIDDFQKIATPENCAFIQTLIGNPHRIVQVALTSPVRPDLEISRLSANGLLKTIAPSQLRFTISEGKAFLGARCAPSLAEDLIEYTGGWPSLLQIARTVARFDTQDDTPPKHVPVGDIMADERFADYLDEQILGAMGATERALLEHVCVFDCFDREICEALMDCALPQNLFRDLTAMGHIAARTDEGHQSYTLHPAIKAFLIMRLRESPSRQESALRKQAAELLLDRQRYREAVGQALSCNDFDFLEQLVRKCGGWRLAFLEGIDVWAALADLPAARLDGRAQLQLARAYYYLQRGKVSEARAHLELLSENPGSWRDDDRISDDEVTLFDLILTIYEDRLLTEQQRLRLLDRVDETGRHTEITISALISEMLAWEQLYAGQFENTVTMGWQSVRLCEENAADFLKGYALLAVGNGHLMQGNLRSATIHLENAARHTALEIGPSSDQHIAAQAYCAEVHIERGEFDRAGEMIEPAWQALERLDLWSDLAFTIIRVKSIHVMYTDDLDAALAVCEEALERVGGHGFVRLARLTGLHMVNLALVADDICRADALAERMAIAQCCEDLPPQQAIWRIELEAAIIRCRLGLATGNIETANFMLGKAENMLRRSRSSRYRIDLLLCKARLSLVNDHGEAQRLVHAATASAELNGQLLPLLQAGRWLDTYLRSDPDTSATPSANRPFLQRLREARMSEEDGPEALSIPTPDGLSPREAEVFIYLCRGFTNKEIATALDLSVNTIMGYRKTMYAKLGVSTRSRLVEMAAGRASPAPV